MESHYPVDVKPIDDYKIQILFDNNECRFFDVKPYLADSYYAPLKNRAIFNSVKTTPISIEWLNEIDFCPDELYYNSNLLLVYRFTY